jgi:ClpP class serine protease
VSSNTISNTLTSFCKAYDIKLMTFAEEYALSGGYWLLSAGDEVYSNRSSKVGSIGALMTSMDFKEFLNKKNIDRIYLSSKKEDGSVDLNKSLDLFQHKSEEEFEFMRSMIKDVHVNFKEHVMRYRKDKLTKDEVMLERIFNADIFVGQDAKDLG